MRGTYRNQTAGITRYRFSGWLILGLFFAGIFPFTSVLAATVNGVRMWAGPDNTRLVFDISGPINHKVFVLRGPDRVVVDMKDTRLLSEPGGLDYNDSLVTGLRSGERNGNDLRMVLDLKNRVRPRSFLLKPTQQYGHRLVIDLEDTRSSQALKATREAPDVAIGAPRDVIIAIDAGHGGEDPGASGRHGTREKDVVLAIARELEKLVSQERGMRPVMIRRGDYFLGLKDRRKKARELKADLFISIHADAFRDGRARGASVYTLSQGSATSQAANWLAENENNSDLIGGVSLDDKDDLLGSVLLDLSRNASIAASLDVGGEVLKQLKTVGRVHKNRVEQAGFAVLKAPDIPSILVETGYISNRNEEKKLKDPRHQRKLAHAMLNGIRDYFDDNAPPGTLLAMADRKHVIRRGDTLSGIAEAYQVSLGKLRSANQLASNSVLKIGETLRIPSL
ncbi:N-acetylmuramoyl-L-alanine amidase [Kaarinaea lacus]